MAYDQFGKLIPDGSGPALPPTGYGTSNMSPPGGYGPTLNQMLANPSLYGGSNSAAMGYTSGPPGSSGGLTGSPQQTQYGYGMGGWTGNPSGTPQMSQQDYWQQYGQYSASGPSGSTPQQTQYGYGTAPGQTGTGYYQQDTPVGAFAAADYAQMGPQQYAQQQYGTAQGFQNPYIGQRAAQISGPSSVMGYASQGQYQNPYLGQSSGQAQGAGANQYMGQNPYLQQHVNDALKQASDSYSATVLPQFDRMDRQSGAYGNTGVQAARNRSIDAFGRSQAATAANAYMQDYGQTQQLAENALNRGQANNQFNAGLSAQDLSRNMAGGFQQAGMNNGLLMQGAMFDAGNQLQTQRTNATAQNDMAMSNANLAQGQGQFNAGAQNQNSMFNAGQGNQLNTFNAGQGNQMNMFGTGQRNGMNMFNAGQGNSMLENYRNRQQQQGQFDANFGLNVDNTNWNRMRQGQQDQIGLYDTLQRWGQNGVNNATTIQNMPLWYQQQFGNLATQYGGMGGSSSNTQNLQGNPYLSAFGGWLTGGNLYNNWGG